MKTIKILLFIFSSALLSRDTNAQGSKGKYCRAEIFASPKEIAARSGLHYDHGYYDFDKSSFTTDLAIEDLARLNAASIHYTVLVTDVVADLLEKNSHQGFYDNDNQPVRNPLGRQNFENPCAAQYTSLSTPTLFTVGSMGGYYTYTEMVAKIDELVATYPGFVQKINIGTSQFGGLTIWAMKVSDNVTTDENEPEVLYTGLIHAREPMGMMNQFFFVQYMLQNYNTDTRMKAIVDNRELFFVLCANPDGYEYNYSTDPGGGGMHRKNRRNVGTTNKGVDINRNFGVDFGWDNIGSSSVANDDDYRGGPLASMGGVPYTESESVAIRNFCQLRHFTIQIDNHTYGNYLSLPYGVAVNHPLTTEEINFYDYAPAQLAKYNCFKAGTSIQTVGYNTNGTAKDYYIAGDIGVGNKGKIFSFTSEAGDAADGFWPPIARIIPIAKEMFFQNVQLALMGGCYFDLQDASSITLPATLSGNLSFNLRRVGRTNNQDVVVSIIPLENIYTSATTTVLSTSFPNYFDGVTATVPYSLPAAITAGQRVKFIWKVECDGITTAVDTVVKFYNLTAISSDDMEGATFTTNWTSSVGGTWNYATDQKVSGNKGLTESPGVRYAQTVNTNATYKQVIDLSTPTTTAAYLTFWVRHEAHNCYDNMRVMISTNWNGTTGTFNTVCGKTTVTENDGTLGGSPAITGERQFWTRELIQLPLGSANVGLRFNFQTNGDTVRGDGYFIDDIQILKSTTPMLILPVKFISVSGWLTSDKSIQVVWQAEVDQKHAYFEVEKSTDRENFTPIARINGMTYEAFDRNPSQGNNYYRVKEVDLDGNVSYSKIIKIIYSPLYFTLSLYPNPASDQLAVRMNTLKPENLNIIVTDLSSRICYSKPIRVDNSNSESRIEIRSWAQQVYVLKILNNNGEILTVQKFVKQ